MKHVDEPDFSGRDPPADIRHRRTSELSTRSGRSALGVDARIGHIVPLPRFGVPSGEGPGPHRARGWRGR